MTLNKKQRLEITADYMIGKEALYSQEYPVIHFDHLRLELNKFWK